VDLRASNVIFKSQTIKFVQTSQALSLFLELAAIPSPPGSERAVADRVTAELRELGLEVHEDGSGSEIGSEIGNLYAAVPATNGGGVPLFFCAHLDTVPPQGPIEPFVEDGVVRNGAGTILGADNKAAVAAMIEAVRRVVREGRPHAGIELLLTPKEEVGLIGATAFDESRLVSRVGYVYDMAAPIGTVIMAAPYSRKFDVRFHGKAAHSGMYPEEGRSAIAAAARAIADFRLGRLDDETTANIGVIDGGLAGNVVPAHCRVEGEARSLDSTRAAEVAGSMSEACAWGAGEHGCDVEVSVEEVFRGYRVPRSSPALALAESGLRRAGVEPERVATGGGSDANALVAKGFDCVLLANGTLDNHTSEERVAGRELDRMLEICEAIVAVAGA
jgi:tripeptide aminopeptidase